jgi:flagellin
LNRASDFTSRKDGMGEAIQNVQSSNAGITAITALVSAARGLSEAALGTTVTSDRAAFAKQYNTLQAQITQLSSDSGYRGTNLLTAANLTVNFNESASSKITVTGFNATASGLSLTSAASDWASSSNILADQVKMDAAVTTLRKEAKNLASNLNIITTRQSFTDSMISTLQTGADNLTLADLNVEGANMLMLQTRQSLGTTALSMSSQAAQAVLRLF